MRMTDDPAQQDADRKDRRTQKWLEHCAACHDELLAACKAARRWLQRIEVEYPSALNSDAIEKHISPAIKKAEAKP